MSYEFSPYQACPICGRDLIIDESETRPIAGQWHGQVITWVAFYCQNCRAVTLEFDEDEGYLPIWPYSDELDGSDQIDAEEAIAAYLFDLTERAGHRLPEEMCQEAGKRALFLALSTCAPALMAG